MMDLSWIQITVSWWQWWWMWTYVDKWQ